MGERSGLEISDAVVYYQRTQLAVDGVTLRVGPGEVVAVLGASGSGKSTLLRAVAGLEPLASGKLRWDGADIAGLPVHRRGFVMMFQEGQLFPHLNVAENVGYGLSSLPRAERERRVRELLELVELPGYAERPVATLSGGEAQRVALARSLAPKPRLLLLDEPFSSLDRGLREHLVRVVGTALRSTGTPALFVTHDQEEAFALADRIAVLDWGKVLQSADPVTLWQHPASRAVAEFLGYGPFLDADAAATLGVRLTPGELLAVGPRALVASPDGLSVPVLSTRHGRGRVVATVTLPGGSQARVRTNSDPKGTMRVRLAPDECATVPE
jgi:thiamine transport system ATP-binding protein